MIRHHAVVEQANARGHFRFKKQVFGGDVVVISVKKLHSLRGTIHNVIDEFPAELRASRHATAQSKRSTG